MPSLPVGRFALITLLLATRVAGQATPAACVGEPVTLVLSGGGAKGLAHIGLIEELQRAQVPIKMVVGSSMGALVGALYATYGSGREIAAKVKEDPLRRLFLPMAPSGPVAWGGLVPLLLWEEGARGFALQGSDQHTAANGVLNATFLGANLAAAGDFNRLIVPLRVVATDLHTRAPVVLKSGDIAQAVRASISVPLVFPPEVIGNQSLVDGGLSANIPIAVARAEGASLLIVSDVSSYPDSAQRFDSPVHVANRLLDWLFLQRSDSLGPHDLRIRPPVDRIDPTDYSPTMIDSLVGLGRTAARAMLSKWECLPVPLYSTAIGGIVHLPKPVAEINAGTGDASALREILSALKLVPNARVDIAATSLRLRVLGESDRFREVWLTPSLSERGVDLNPVIRRLPRRSAGVGLAYDGELGGRVWGGFLDRRLPLLQSEVAGVLAVGRYRSTLDLSARRATLFGHAGFSPLAVLQLDAEDHRRFTNRGDELGSDPLRQIVGRLGVERYFGPDLRLTVGGELRSAEEVTPLTRVQQHRSGSALFGELSKRAGDGTTVGRLQIVAGESYRQVTFAAVIRGVVAGVRLEQQLRVGIGDSLPVALTTPLGGAVGFPGLHQGALRGDHELFTSLTLSHHLVGPLKWRVTGAAGRNGYRGLPTSFISPDNQELTGSRGDWLAGGRVGVGASTPIGPLQIEYGVTSRGREAVLLRVGRWF